MHYAANFHPAWGYAAPAPSLLHTARVVLVASAVGATTGAGVAISLVNRPAPGESSVAARTLARPAQTSLAVPDILRAAQASAQSGVASQSADALMADTGKGNAAVSEARHSSTIEAREGAAILAESATAINEPTAKSAAAPLGAYAPSLAASAPATPAPVQDKVVGKKPRLAYRYAPRDELVDRVPGGQYMTGGWIDHSTNTSKRDGYGPNGWERPYGGAYRNGRREAANQDGGRRFRDWGYRDRW